MVAALALSRAGSKLPVLPLSLLGVNQFAWNVATVGGELSGDSVRYRWVGHVAAPLFVPLALHFVIGFIGKRRALRGVLTTVYALFAAKSLLTLADLWVPGFDLPGGLAAHRLIALGLIVPVGAGAVVLAARSLRETRDGAERWRARILLGAIVMALVLFPTDWISALGVPVPPLAKLGSIAFNLALTWLVLDTDDAPPSPAQGVGAAALLALFVVSAYLGVFVSFRERQGELLIAVAGVTLALLALGRLLMLRLRDAWQALERQAIFGRTAAQLAHDIRNRLAPAYAVAETLQEDLRAPGQSQQRRDAERLVGHLDLLVTLLDRYKKLAKLELSLTPLDPNALVMKVVEAVRPAAPAGVTVRLELAEACGHVDGDRDLLAAALENLAVNAFDALGPKGQVTVRTRPSEGHVTIVVNDNGRGMDPMEVERAGTPGFTTKAQGSGLGLAFVHRVVQAHGGAVRLSSTKGAGTTVDVSLPLRAATR
jgi:signal transduction histidine kinase